MRIFNSTMTTYMKRLSPTLQMQLRDGDKDNIYFIRRKLEDLSSKTLTITKGLLQLMLKRSAQIEQNFKEEDRSYCVISKRNFGHLRFEIDQYTRLALCIRPRDRAQNFNMLGYEYSNMIAWKDLLQKYFSLVS